MQNDPTVWPPAPTHQAEPNATPQSSFSLRPLANISSVNIMVGIADCGMTQASDPLDDIMFYGAAFALGVRYHKWFLLTGVSLTFCLYIAHVVAIACGLRSPFVENNYNDAQNCLFELYPALLFAGLGAFVRVVHNGMRYIFQIK